MIQNEQIIETMADALPREGRVKEIQDGDVKHFSILVDGTKDKNRNECISLAVRFESSGRPLEVLLQFGSTEELDADVITS